MRVFPGVPRTRWALGTNGLAFPSEPTPREFDVTDIPIDMYFDGPLRDDKALLRELVHTAINLAESAGADPHHVEQLRDMTRRVP